VHPLHLAFGAQLARESVHLALAAPVAQLDRASGFEPEGREFESLRARETLQRLNYLRTIIRLPFVGARVR